MFMIGKGKNGNVGMLAEERNTAYDTILSDSYYPYIVDMKHAIIGNDFS